MHDRASRLRPAACAAALLLAAACATQPVRPGRPDRGPGRVITAEQISRTSARTAWEVLQRVPLPHALRRGLAPASATGAAAGRPVVVVNGMRLGDMDQLGVIPASSIAQMRLISAVDASVLYGADANAGAIEILVHRGR